MHIQTLECMSLISNFGLTPQPHFHQFLLAAIPAHIARTFVHMAL